MKRCRVRRGWGGAQEVSGVREQSAWWADGGGLVAEPFLLSDKHLDDIFVLMANQFLQELGRGGGSLLAGACGRQII